MTYLSRKLCFYLSSFPHWHYFLFLSISQRWLRDLATSTQQITGKLYRVSCLAAVATLREKSWGAPMLLQPSTHHLPQLTHSQLYRKFTTLWPRVNMPFWINTKVIKCSWVVGLKYQSCFIAGIQDLFLAWYRCIESEGLRGIFMRW